MRAPRHAAQETAIVTETSKGLGAAIATALAREGAAVIVSYASSADAAKAVTASITDAGGKALADVGKADQARAMVATAAETFGGVDRRPQPRLVPPACLSMWPTS